MLFFNLSWESKTTQTWLLNLKKFGYQCMMTNSLMSKLKDLRTSTTIWTKEVGRHNGFKEYKRVGDGPMRWQKRHTRKILLRIPHTHGENPARQCLWLQKRYIILYKLWKSMKNSRYQIYTPLLSSNCYKSRHLSQQYSKCIETDRHDPNATPLNNFLKVMERNSDICYSNNEKMRSNSLAFGITQKWKKKSCLY